MAFTRGFGNEWFLLVAAPVIFLLILNSQTASALGISPPGVSYRFEPGLDTSFTGYVRNTGDVTMPIKLAIEGDLKQYVTSNLNETVLNPREVRYFTIFIKLPQEIEKPGKHIVSVRAEEHPEKLSGSRTSGVSAVASVGFKITILVPYPGKYLEGRISVENTKLGDPVPLTISLSSFGTENVTANGIIKISEEDTKQTLATLYPNSVLVESKGQSSMSATWDTNGVKPGRYTANATITYGGKRPLILAKQFKVGDVLLKIENITYNSPLHLDEISKFVLTIDSYWNEKINNTYIVMNLLKDGEEISSMKSETFDIDAWTSKDVMLYLDTHGLEEGKYQLKFEVYYLDKVTEKKIDIEIKPYFDMLLLLLIIAVAVLAVIMAVIYKKKKKK